MNFTISKQPNVVHFGTLWEFPTLLRRFPMEVELIYVVFVRTEGSLAFLFFLIVFYFVRTDECYTVVYRITGLKDMSWMIPFT